MSRVSDDVIVISSNVIELDEEMEIEYIMKEMVSILTSKVYTVNRRLAGSIPLIDHHKRNDIILKSTIKNGIIHKLISKTDAFSQECYEICHVDYDEFVVSVESICLDNGKHPHIPFPYYIKFTRIKDKKYRIDMKCGKNENSSWLIQTMIPSIIRWIHNILSRKNETIRNPLCEGTNKLIGVEEYTKKYREVKNDLGKTIARNWIDKTSAEKFVYEDCGIATYLSLLWSTRSIKPTKFVDVGCGNGLLVHLLNQLEYSGCGVDLRERKTWKTMFPNDELIESTLNPSISSSNGLPIDCDYLIGNHSDELTPWIPIMAAHLNIPFFLLPCCPFDFYGKLCKKGSSSLYEDLIVYIKDISERLGYIVEIDKLAIPSTKRTALICTIPSYGLRKDVNEEIEKMLEESRKGREFIARPKEEKVRNCSSISKEKRDELITRVFNKLMEGEDKKGNEWRKGKSLPLINIVSLLSIDEKKLMKEQCGGVQTFLKNQHQIFKIVNGCVKLKDWKEEIKNKKDNKRKTSQCWFHHNHPDGCPLIDEQCSFIHSSFSR